MLNPKETFFPVLREPEHLLTGGKILSLDNLCPHAKGHVEEGGVG